MWPKNAKDYPEDTPLKKEKVAPGNGIIGCEMHDLNGWGNTLHVPKKRKKGVLATLISSFFGNNRNDKPRE